MDFVHAITAMAKVLYLLHASSQGEPFVEYHVRHNLRDINVVGQESDGPLL